VCVRSYRESRWRVKVSAQKNETEVSLGGVIVGIEKNGQEGLKGINFYSSSTNFSHNLTMFNTPMS
jgi:hypothetical protein